MAMTLVSLMIYTLICHIDVIAAGNVETTLPGHMLPLGSHRPFDPIDEVEVDAIPSPKEFWAKYVKPSRPMVFRGAAKKFPAFTKWTDEYLAKKYPEVELRLEGRREKFGRPQVGDKGLARDTLGNFVSRYHNRDCDSYIVSELPKNMYHEVMLLPSMSCGSLKNRVVEVDFWMNGGNASSVLHKDAYNQLNCLLNGTKEWKLIDFKNEKNIYKAWEPLPSYGGYSKINVKEVNMVKYPKVAKTPWMFTTLQAGDCLFLPKSMWHHVNSYGTHNMAVSLLFSRWDRRKDLNFKSCKNDTYDFVPLSDTEVDWEYPGHGDMSMGNNDLEQVRSHLYETFSEEGQVTLKELLVLTKQTYSEKSKELIMERANKTYQILTDGGTVKITKKAIIKMSKEQLREMAWCLERVAPSNAYWYEYNNIAPDYIREVIVKLLKKGNNKLKREVFINKYINRLEGTKEFGHRLFDRLAGEGKDEVTRDEVMKNLNDALQKYFEHQEEGELAVAKGRPGFEIVKKESDDEENTADIHELIDKDDRERKNNADQDDDEKNNADQDDEVGDDDEENEGENRDDEGEDKGDADKGNADKGNEGKDSEKHDEL